MVDYKVIWNTRAPRGWRRYSGNPGVWVTLPVVVFAKGVLSVPLILASSMVISGVVYL